LVAVGINESIDQITEKLPTGGASLTTTYRPPHIILAAGHLGII